MVGRLLGALSGFLVYFCIATIIAQLIGIGYLAIQGRLDQGRLIQLAAIVQGVDLLSVKNKVEDDAGGDSYEQMAFHNIEQARAVAENDFRLREQSLQKQRQSVEQMRDDLASQIAEMQVLRKSFEQQLTDVTDQAVDAGRENVRQILENVKPPQAKQQIMRMVEAGEIAVVVQLLADMPIANKKKIIAEFKDSKDDAETLEEILRLLREGVPTTNIVEQARADLGARESTR